MFRFTMAFPAAIALFATISHAAPHLVYAHQAVDVKYGDLDLGSANGGRILLARIERAADEVCGGRPERRNDIRDEGLARLMVAYRKCREGAVAETVGKLLVPTLSLAYEQSRAAAPGRLAGQ